MISQINHISLRINYPRNNCSKVKVLLVKEGKNSESEDLMSSFYGNSPN